MEMYQIKETVLQDNTYSKYLEKVMGGRHRFTPGFRGFFPFAEGRMGVVNS